MSRNKIFCVLKSFFLWTTWSNEVNGYHFGSQVSFKED